MSYFNLHTHARQCFRLYVNARASPRWRICYVLGASIKARAFPRLPLKARAFDSLDYYLAFPDVHAFLFYPSKYRYINVLPSEPCFDLDENIRYE